MKGINERRYLKGVKKRIEKNTAATITKEVVEPIVDVTKQIVKKKKDEKSTKKTVVTKK